MGVDFVVAGGVIASIGEYDDVAPQNLRITNGYSKAEVSLSRAWGGYPSFYGGFYGFNFAGATLDYIVATGRLIPAPSSSVQCRANIGCDAAPATTYSHLYYLRNSPGVTLGASVNNVEKALYLDEHSLLELIEHDFPVANGWKVKGGRYGFAETFESHHFCEHHEEHHHYEHNKEDKDDDDKKRSQ